jgi:outer membrane receptor protein involved in Fe transport
MNINLNVRNAVRLAIAATAAAAGSGALAQNAATGAAKELEEVIVTGSRIAASPNDVSVAPVTSITAADIEKTGLVRAEDLLNNLPQVIAENNSGQSISSNGTATVSLRGLGSTRTLVLINGRRMQPGGGITNVSSPDINQIPAAMVERVDVLTGGASSTYGADAVAGVVNFIMNTHFTGVKVDFDYGTNHHANDNAFAKAALTAAGRAVPGPLDGGQNRDFSIVVGANFADGKGNATAYGTYLNTAPVAGYQLDYAACTLNSASSPPTGGAAWDPVACGGSSTSATGRFRLFGIPVGGTKGVRLVNSTVDGTTGLFRPYSSTTDSYNYGALSYAQRKAERYTAGAFLNYDVTDHMNVYSETMYALNSSSGQYGPSGAFAYVDATTHCSNPLFTPSEVAAFCDPVTFAANHALYPNLTGDQIQISLARRSVESGGRVDNYSSTSIREVMGIKGTLGNAWSYDAYGQYGITNMANNEDGFLSVERINKALDVVANPATGGVVGVAVGAPVCTSALNGTDPKCIPWNIWQKGGVTPAQINYLTTQSTYTATAKEYIVDGSVTGDLGKYGIKVPTAADGVIVNIGAEYRQEGFAFKPDYIFANGLASGGNGAFTPVNGLFHANDYFLETKVPIADNHPGIHHLGFEGGYRYSDYSLGYKTDTFKLGLEWAPIQDIKVRASYNRAVRAPNISNLYAPAFIGAGGNADPCWGTNPTFTVAQCQLTGLDPGNYGLVGANPAAQINNTTGGNPNLVPEKADTYTVGFVLQPEAFKGFVMSLDYYHIKIDDTIQNLSTDTVLNNCAKHGLQEYCSRIHRNPTSGTLWEDATSYVDTDTRNIGTLVTAGYDLTARYSVSIGGMGKLNFGLTGSKVSEYSTQATPTSTAYDCTGLYGTVCLAPTPKWKHTLETDWATPWAGLVLSGRWRYTGSVDVDKSSSNEQLTGAYQPGFGHIGGYTYIDLSASIAWGSHLNFRLGANNVGDKGPPIVINGNLSNCPNTTCNDNTWVGTYDTLGRYMYAHVTAKF